MKIILIVMLFMCTGIASPCYLFAQSKYQYRIDLTKTTDHTLQVELLTPKIDQPDIDYFFPAIIPGTYSISDYGRFVSDLKAFDEAGKELPVEHLKANGWKVGKAQQLYRITYVIQDTWHSKITDNVIYPMGGTNIESQKQYVINTPGFFGYFDKMEKLPVEMQFRKPAGFYGSSALNPASSNDTTDLFKVEDIHELYDSPIMYCKPDTAIVDLGRSQVLISVFSAGQQIHAASLARAISHLLAATQEELGGKLPVKKYAFLYSFSDELRQSRVAGALEHNYSSFYAFPPLDEKAVSTVIDVSAHEFFHILTPLSISSKEIHEFNYQQPVLSKHLWLYEGSTEYDAHHVQVKSGLTSVEKFLENLASKIITSKKEFNDTLPFTVMSKEVATTYADQYPNVYQKGALISACLDIYLLHLSRGRYGLTNLKHDLGIKFGRDKYFDDDRLFDEIAMLSFPEVKDFLNKYVGSSTPIPYTDIFALAGVYYHDHLTREVSSIGNIGILSLGNNKVSIVGTVNMNDFGKKMKYKLMDEIIGINGQRVTGANYEKVIGDIKAKLKMGDTLTMVVRRKNESGDINEITLSAPVSLKERKDEYYKMELMEDSELTSAQRIVKNAWLKNNCN